MKAFTLLIFSIIWFIVGAIRIVMSSRHILHWIDKDLDNMELDEISFVNANTGIIYTVLSTILIFLAFIA